MQISTTLTTNPPVSKIMTRDVLTVPPTMPIAALAALLAERHISGVPVQDSNTGSLLGMITEGDMIRRIAGRHYSAPGLLALLFGSTEKAAAQYARTNGMTVASVMQHPPLVTVNESDDAAEAARLMEQHNIRRVPVLRGEKLVGIVSRADLLRLIVTGNKPAPDVDATIRMEIRKRMNREVWTDIIWHLADVNQGVVTLHGYARSEAVRLALQALVAGIPGVERVIDQMEEPPFTLYAPGLV